MNVQAVINTLKDVAPIAGVRHPFGDSKKIIIDFLPEATEEEKAAAQAIADTWIDPPENPSDRAWNQLVTDLLNSDLWVHAKAASKQSLGANTAFTVAMSVLTVTRQIEQFALAWADLRNELSDTSLGDFNQGQLDAIALLLERQGFALELFDLVK